MRRSVSRNGPVMERSGPGAGVVPGTSRRWAKTYELASSATELGSQINAIPTANTGSTSPA
jgi:hypothetical protein